MNTHTKMLKTYYSTFVAPDKLKFFKPAFLRISYLILLRFQKALADATTGQKITAVILSAILMFSADSKAQNDAPGNLGPFELQLRTENPLRESINIAIRPTPATIDFDHDGDFDVMLASFDGANGFHLLRNDGTNTTPDFNYALYWDNPFNFITFDDGGTATFADLDHDGDQDMLLGILDGTFRYYKNNPEATYKYSLQASPWDAVTKSGNPFFGIDLGDYASPIFVDMDNDGDQDVVAGTSYLPDNKSIHYFINNGEGNFSEGLLDGINPALEEVTPVFLDVDQDGDKDIVIGAADGNLYYFKRTGSTSFQEQTGADNPFNGINKGLYSSPSSADFDNDGDDDLIFGADNPLLDLFYFENKGNSVFEEKTSFDNPFDGIDVGGKASPYFTDFDDDGDADLVIGNGYGSPANLVYFENVNGSYTLHTDTNPFAGLEIPAAFVPSFIDLDGDGDKDLVGGVADHASTSIEFYRNENGVFARQEFSTGPFKDIIINEGKSDFVDIDNDGDFDLFISETVTDNLEESNHIRFYKNTGTTESPEFTAMTGTDNPLSQVVEEFKLFPRFNDIDHDGDFDALIGEGGDVIEISDGNEFSYYENTGTITQPVFTYRGDLIPQGDSPYEPAPAFIDYDNDGDLDAFIGSAAGTIALYKNNNSAAVLSIDSQPISITGGSGQAFIDSQLTLSDADNDAIVYASVSINSYQPGKETLAFTPQAGITGLFNTATGILIFTGKAPLAIYQSVLRSVVYSYASDTPSGRQRPQDRATIARTVTIRITDSDGTNALAVNKTINIISGTAPVFADHSVSIKTNSVASIDLSLLISDADSNTDLNSITITVQPGSGAITNIDGNAMLTADYTTLDFAGTETISLQVCDADNNCDQGVITITVTNTPPVMNDHSMSISFAASATVDLIPLISDDDNNLDLTSLSITQQPLSGAVASIDVNSILIVDYSAVNFTGTETISLQICDTNNSCDQGNITLTVTNTTPVINDHSISILFAASATIDLIPLISDEDNNLDFSSLSITQQPPSGAVATIDDNSLLTVNYAGRNFTGTETLEVSICDLAGACTQNTITMNVINTPPVSNPLTLTLPFRGEASLDLAAAFTDEESNIDFTTLQITQSPSSGASATVGSDHILRLSYNNLSFSGSEDVHVSVCDVAGECAQAVITINITNAAPVIQPEPVSMPLGTRRTINLLQITSDPDGNLDHSTLLIVQSPVSGAMASIEFISPTEVNLMLDYSGTNFSGQDQLTISVCDLAGVCTESIITIDVETVPVEIFNAVAPNSSGDNKYMRIVNLPQPNKVSIFNRWGDVVFDIENYDHETPGKRFEGMDNNGKVLTSGAYFYKIEYVDGTEARKTSTGYLSLKQ